MSFLFPHFFSLLNTLCQLTLSIFPTLPLKMVGKRPPGHVILFEVCTDCHHFSNFIPSFYSHFCIFFLYFLTRERRNMLSPLLLVLQFLLLLFYEINLSSLSHLLLFHSNVIHLLSRGNDLDDYLFLDDSPPNAIQRSIHLHRKFFSLFSRKSNTYPQ